MNLSNTMALPLVAVFCFAPSVRARDGNNDGNNDSAVKNVVYVHTNNHYSGQNSVLAYRRDPATGALTKIHGSPFLTGGAGYFNTYEVLGPDDTDQELVATPDHRFLYVTNEGSNTITGFAVQPDGSLKTLPGSPFPSGGLGPGSIGIDGPLLIVANRGDQNPGGSGGTHAPTYASFVILPEGTLLPLPLSQPPQVPGSSPTQALIAPGGKLLFDSHFFENSFDNTGFPPFIPPYSTELHSYRITPFGQLIPAAQTAPTSVPPFILGLQVHPTQKILYAGFVVASALGTYTYDDDGNMTLVGVTAGATNGGLCWIAISPDAKNLYTSDAITDQIDVYSIAANPLNPVLVQTLSLAGTKNPANFDVTATFWDTTPFQLRTSPDGKFLFVVNHEVSNPAGNMTGDALHVMQIGAGGMLTEVPSSPRYLSLEDGVPATVSPLGVVVF